MCNPFAPDARPVTSPSMRTRLPTWVNLISPRTWLPLFAPSFATAEAPCGSDGMAHAASNSAQDARVNALFMILLRSDRLRTQFQTAPPQSRHRPERDRARDWRYVARWAESRAR